ncbi:hypothetical protein RIB2604_02110090 [Aspergillus luchuensis]|uniref:Uncharacterized protein n=1 Tax=Aspergillus kawachii TaxID=1069201 RepID=A0A146FQQ4_ASPKA|nr:hypothetical protein RIB2604_02110090 [Aspergillus luchuensis]
MAPPVASGARSGQALGPWGPLGSWSLGGMRIHRREAETPGHKPKASIILQPWRHPEAEKKIPTLDACRVRSGGKDGRIIAIG